MKSNLISGIASWKSAALLAIVALVAAVAFSGVLTTNTAEAATVSLADADSSATAAPGDTVNIVVDDATFLQVSIASSSTASGGFGVSGAQSIACPNGTPGCDTGTEDADSDAETPETDIADSIQVSLLVDDDSPEGFILINISGIGTEDATKVITVSKAGQVGSVTATAALPAIAATTGLGTTSTTVTAVVMNAQANPAGLNGQTVKFNVEGPAVCDANTGSQVCEVTSADYDHDGDGGTTPAVPGGAIATITATGRPGAVTVTASVGGKESTADITVFGAPVAITAEAEQSSIEVGTGSTFIIVTATDAGGNPVSGREYGVKAPGGIAGPSEESVPVSVSAAVNKHTGEGDNADTGAIDPKTGELPSCDAKAAVPADDAATPPVAAEAASTGTDAAGKCVIQVTAPANAANPALTTSRGTHTITIAGPLPDGSSDVTVEISVGGPPASIEHDTPARVDALTEHTVNLTVLDNEGVKVGKQTLQVIAIGGALAGTITADPPASTTDGVGSFSFLAPPGTGTISFLVRAGDLPNRTQQLIEVAVGPAPVEVPDAPPATWNNELVSGQNYAVWNGDDGADPSEGAAEGVSAIWSYNSGSGSWDGYFPDAADVPGGNTLTSLSNGQAYVVIVD